MMDRAEMVAWLRKPGFCAAQSATAQQEWKERDSQVRSAAADELERLGHLETEHQGCTENMASLVRERDEAVAAWKVLAEGVVDALDPRKQELKP